MEKTKLILRGISLPYRESPEAALAAAKRKLNKAGLNVSSLCVAKRSVDARKKENILFVYSVQAEVCSPVGEAKLKALNASRFEEEPPMPEPGGEELSARPVIVGFGPCGMFAALCLARAGYAPLVLERGDEVRLRREAVDRFLSFGILDPNSNVQFGAGGAGTFSDGKLVTRVNDPLGASVIEDLCRFGAPESIRTLAKPHVGTDRLLFVVSNVEKEIVRLGGEVRCRTRVTGFSANAAGRVTSVLTDKGEIPCGALILAVGHSARDIYAMLAQKGVTLLPKDFSVGVRVEHLQSEIDYALYGDADLSVLGHAEYTLSHREGNRGVYSFCMCPGGQVLCASSEEEGLVVNGMSNYARDGRNANSAIAVSVLKEDCGSDPMKAIAFQRALERRAYFAAGGGFKAPIETLGDFLGEYRHSEPKRVLPSFRGGEQTSVCDLSAILPPAVTSMLKRGFPAFERQISGFCAEDSILTGVETRTSAPLRIRRTEALTAPGYDNFYPCGEGAGYAGGITSAAIDGLRCARAIIGRYRPPMK